MIVYQATKGEFSDDVLSDTIELKIHESFRKQLNKGTSKQEIASWKNSLQYMDRVLNDPEIPDDCGVAIEYQLPQTAKRIDFILTGVGKGHDEYAILIELKQWSEATLSSKDGIINSFVGGNIRELTHPSYQAWSYATLLQNFNETVVKDNINLKPCAYLHNYVSDDVITNAFYQEYIDKAPVFLRGDAVRLRNFIKSFVKHGDKRKIIYKIDQGKIRPSKMLADSMVSLLKGNQEFVMIDDQKIVYETALTLSRKATANKKHVLIVKGGPGTGKSVVAINLLVEITRLGLLTQYVSKNAAPRAVYESKLTGTLKKTVISNLFGGSGSFVSTRPNEFDVLIVDEAHRLNEKSGLYSNLGDNQIKEIIRSARCSVFFIDEDQSVTMKDIGSIDEIKKWASHAKAEVTEMELSSQFRCNGSDGYLAWLDNSLQIRETANPTLEGIDYDFRVFSDPNELRNAILEKNKENNKSRMVAGYCWNWASKKNPDLYDVVIPEFDFKMKWNLTQDGSLWIISPDSVNEIGCIHTCQGLEVDYIGVIIGPDLIVRDESVLTQPLARAKSDKSVFGHKKLLEKKPEEGKAILQRIIKNTYRTLMTRGMKGCYVYVCDENLREYLSKFIKPSQTEKTINILPIEKVIPFENAVPIYDLKAAAGNFSELQVVGENKDDFDWVELPSRYKSAKDLFACTVKGESMNKVIPNGSICLFRKYSGGSRNGKIVLVQHTEIQDPDFGSGYTVKEYHSTKTIDSDSWEHQSITLKPLSYDMEYQAIEITEDDLVNLKVLGVFEMVL